MNDLVDRTSISRHICNVGNEFMESRLTFPHNYVIFDVENMYNMPYKLHLKNLISDIDKQKFKLKGFINYTPAPGHYTAIIKRPDGRWEQYNDTCVTVKEPPNW